jgi:hypothetical protein
MEPGLDADPFLSNFSRHHSFVESQYNLSTKRETVLVSGFPWCIQALNMLCSARSGLAMCLRLSTGYFPEPLKILEEKYSSALKNPEINKLKLFVQSSVPKSTSAFV